MRHLAGTWREALFAALNVGGVFGFFYYDYGPYHICDRRRFAIYLVVVVVQFIMLQIFAKKGGWLPWLAFFAPIAALIAVRYVPGEAYIALDHALGKMWLGVPNMIGISYLAFRCSRLVLEVRNGVVQKPNFLEYLNFAFFLPTMPVGPINTYANFRRGFAERYDVPMGRAALRILVGAVKYQFLGNLCNKLTYSGLLLDTHPHRWMDLPVAMLFFYLYLYLNFSGFCDMAIGAAGLMGIAVPENFNNPFAARNLKDFWNRWHITLSAWMRDIVFSPLSKFLMRVMGVRMADHAIALAILATFLLIGIWHGTGWNYAAFGLAQALGVATVHYYTIFLKRRLGRDGFKAYNENRWIRAAAMVLTFFYFATSLIFFACTFDQINQILAVLKP
jgi:D-alanyl-lipoteichoic acid acyltransferase DltB (MBOAT superfamily)